MVFHGRPWFTMVDYEPTMETNCGQEFCQDHSQMSAMVTMVGHGHFQFLFENQPMTMVEHG